MSAAAHIPAEAAVSAAALHEWVRRAVPGQRFVYFTGVALVQSLDVVKVARQLAECGDVLLTQQRRADRLFDYQVTRRRNAEPFDRLRTGGQGGVREGGRGGCRQAGTPTPRVDEESERLLAVLRRLANFGQPCPSNATLAELAVLTDRQATRYRLDLLHKAGLIRVGGPEAGPRVVTIVSSGRSTSPHPKGIACR